MLLYPKGYGGERSRKRQKYYCHVRLGKLNESELCDEASKSLTDVKKRAYSRPLISAEITCLLAARHPVLRQQDSKSGQLMERENLYLARIEIQRRTHS